MRSAAVPIAECETWLLQNAKITVPSGARDEGEAVKIQINHMLGEFGTGFAISGATDFEEPFP
ncbi:MAG: hypothetical protein VX512_00955 [Pseudomonadota bacterium]|nr:hypothetical protein [Pseudomonadota bacterium]